VNEMGSDSPMLVSQDEEEGGAVDWPWDTYNSSPSIKDAGPFIQCEVISPELLATIDFLVMMTGEPSISPMGCFMPWFFNRVDWYYRPEVKAKFAKAFALMTRENFS